MMGKVVEKAVRQVNFVIKKKNYILENFNELEVPQDHLYTFCTILMPLLKKTELLSLRSG